MGKDDDQHYYLAVLSPFSRKSLLLFLIVDNYYFILLQSLYGILQDDYDYGSVREQLEPSLQQFIRTACRHPASIHPDLIHNILLDLSTSEKVNKTSGLSKLTDP